MGYDDKKRQKDWKDNPDVQATLEVLPWVCCGCFGFWTVFVLIFVLPFVIYKSSDTESIVVYSKIWARFEPDIVDVGGINTKPYNAQLIKWPRTEDTIEFSGSSEIECNSADGILIDMILTFQYIPNGTALVDLTKEFRNHERWKGIVTSQADSEIRHVCGEFIADDFQANRAEVAQEMELELIKNLAPLGAVVTKLQLQNVERPTRYEKAVTQKENARSDIELAENEREQAITKANTLVDTANEEALRILDSAETTAEILDSQGSAQSAAIIDQFIKLADIYEAAQIRQNLDTAGILTYISSEVFREDVTIAVDAPVDLQFNP